MNGIQIIGTQRSGSNLLRVMLDASPDIAAPHPPHILQTFIPLLPYYAGLSDGYETMVDDVLHFINVNPVPWQDVSFDRDAILRNSRRRNIFELFKLVYEQAAASKGAQYWCCKSMNNVYYADEMAAEGIRPKYIFLYRDGRDLAVSFQKAVVGEKHAYHIAKQWKRDQDECLNLRAKLSVDDFCAIRYEDLIADPVDTLEHVCSFLGIAYHPKMLNYYSSEASRAAASAGKMWGNLTQPVLKNNSRKFLKELSSEEIEIFELVAGDTLQRLGYQTLFSQPNVSKIGSDYIAQYDDANRAMKKHVQMMHPEDMEKRKDQLVVIEKVKARTEMIKANIVL